MQLRATDLHSEYTRDGPAVKAPPISALPKQDTSMPDNLKFSTADRTILEELKRNITAKASQFILKGGSRGATNHASRFGWGAQGAGVGKVSTDPKIASAETPTCSVIWNVSTLTNK